MNAQVKDYISVCHSFQPEQCREPLGAHDVATRPWAKVAADSFTCNECNYLITIDYFSSFLEVNFLTDTLSRTVIEKTHYAVCKTWNSRYFHE